MTDKKPMTVERLVADSVGSEWFIPESELHQRIKKALLTFAAQEVEKAKANRCDWCGSNDLVCGKAWKEEREKLLKENALSLQEATEPLEMAAQKLVDEMKGKNEFTMAEVGRIGVAFIDLEDALTTFRAKYPRKPEPIKGYCKEPDCGGH